MQPEECHIPITTESIQKNPMLFRIVQIAVLIMLLSRFTASAAAQSSDPTPPSTAPTAQVTLLLHSPFFEKLYSRTYWSLLDRLEADGFLPESLTGVYPGMFPRTAGALALLCLETGRNQEAERMIACVLEAMRQNEMDRVPRIISKQNGRLVIEDDSAQIDGQAHVILASARLALKRGRTPFEDQTWEQVSKLMSSTTDRPYLYAQNGLIRNCSFEHSREGRIWDTWDLLTQSFVGAALKDMTALAQRRGETQKALLWEKRLAVLSAGVTKNLTVERDGKTTYLEMRLPDSNIGVPYLGMSWVMFSPVAAGWEPDPDPAVMRNTVAAFQRASIKVTNGMPWMPTDSYADGSFSNQIIGKGEAWEMDYARSQGDYTRVEQILRLLETVHGATPIYMEAAWLQGIRSKLPDRLKDGDLPELEGAAWKVSDSGNGEQTSWWCWAMARLRKQAGMSVEPGRID